MNAQVRAAFADLRRAGYLARMNFLCCSNCAGCELAADAEDRSAKGQHVRGVVYYHQQDAEHAAKQGRLYIRYGPLETSAAGAIGIPAAEIGAEVLETLQRHGLAATWSGCIDDTIEVES